MFRRDGIPQIDMIKRVCEQQPVIVAVLHRRRDLTHLEISSGEWRILENVADLLEPYKDATTYLSSESYPIIQLWGPFSMRFGVK